MTYTPGETVRILKYGKTYRARVVRVGRTTVTVEFRTLGGKTKTLTVPGYEVPLIIKPL